MKANLPAGEIETVPGIDPASHLNSQNMKNNIIRRLTQSLLLAALVASPVCRLEAADLNLFGTNMPPLDFHGFISQGFLLTSKYDYLGNNTKDGSFKFTEAGLNVSMNPLPRTRITAQGFLYDVGEDGKYRPFLDYASVEYTFNDYVGLRGGRIRKPGGIYNDIQDVDLARTYVLLPQSVYDARYRDFSASLDGGEVFGNIPLGGAGGLSYEAYAGLINIEADSAVARLINSSLPGGKITSFDKILEAGTQLWWNSPFDVNGLRVGAAFGYVFNFDYNFSVPTPFGTFPFRAEAVLPVQQYSAEYLWKNWTFQAEYYNVQFSQDTTSPIAPPTHSFSITQGWYGGAAYRFNKWLEAGGYYSEYYVSGAHAAASDASQKDAALSFRFDPKPWWVFKLEGHYIRGTGQLDDNADNPVRNDHGWFMFMAKTTFSF